jgi:hypothetical protein
MKASRPSRKELNRLEHCGAGIGGEAHHLFLSPKMAQIPEILTRADLCSLHLDAVEEDVNITNTD